MKYIGILEDIKSNGGLDMAMVEYNAKHDGVTVREYLYTFVKSQYGCHGNTANKVVSFLM